MSPGDGHCTAVQRRWLSGGSLVGGRRARLAYSISTLPV